MQFRKIFLLKAVMGLFGVSGVIAAGHGHYVPQSSDEEAAMMAAVLAASEQSAREDEQLRLAIVQSKQMAEDEEQRRREAETQKAPSGGPAGGAQCNTSWMATPEAIATRALYQRQVVFASSILVVNGPNDPYCLMPVLRRLETCDEGGITGRSPGFKNRIFTDSVNVAHRTGFLWPLHYFESYFKHGLLNHFIWSLTGVTPQHILHRDLPIAANVGFSWIYDARRRRIGNDDKFYAVMQAYIEGLHRNQFLISVGSAMQKMKFRLEHEHPQNAAEQDRTDLLQDYIYVFIKATHTPLLAFLKAAKESQSLDVNRDVLCQFFEHFTPSMGEGEKGVALTMVPTEKLSLLKNYDFGADNAEAVPSFLKQMVDSGQDQFPKAWESPIYQS